MLCLRFGHQLVVWPPSLGPMAITIYPISQSLAQVMAASGTESLRNHIKRRVMDPRAAAERDGSGQPLVGNRASRRVLAAGFTPVTSPSGEVRSWAPHSHFREYVLSHRSHFERIGRRFLWLLGEEKRPRQIRT